MYKVGDEVLIKGKVGAVDIERGGFPYWVFAPHGMGYWLSEEDITDKTYEKGLADAWELAKKIYDMKCEDVKDIFEEGFWEIINNCTAEEALAKIEAYEKEKEEIKVGDVVKSIVSGYNAVVTVINRDEAHVVFDDGSTGVRKINDLTKTGKHIEIEGVLRKIGV